MPGPMRSPVCACCNSTQFAVLDDVWVELHVRGHGQSTDRDPSFEMRVCTGCGRTELFVRSVEKLLTDFPEALR